MRIGIDVQTLETHERTRGIGRLCARMISLLARHAPEHEYLLYGLSTEPAESVAPLLSARVGYRQIRTHGPAEEHLRLGTTAPFLWTTPDADQLDLYHVTSPLMPDILLPQSGPSPVVATLLDAIPALMHEQGTELFDQDGWQRYQMRLNMLRSYQHYLPISASAAKDSSRLFDLSARRMTVTYVPIEQFPARSLTADGLREALLPFGLRPEGYVISVTGFNPRKNVEGTIRSYALLPQELRQSYPLVLVCALNDSERQQLLALASQHGVSGQIVLTGFVPDEQLTALVKQAALFVFASLFEGFGIPVADAMACGTAVVSSNTTSLPEVVGNAGLLIDPADEQAFADAMERFLLDPALRRQYVAQGFLQAAHFSGERFTERVLQAYAATAQSLQKNQRSTAIKVDSSSEPPLRVACFAPITPCMSGIAEYTEQLLLHLPQLEMDCFIEEYTPDHYLIRERIDCYHFSAFARLHSQRPYNVMLYQMGNNALHAYMLPFIEHYPGVLVLHDFSLLGLYRQLSRQLGERRSAQMHFAEEHPDHDPMVWENDDALGELSFTDFPMVGRLASQSRSLVVHSSWLREELKKLIGENVPIAAFPLGVSMNHVLAPRPPREELRRRYLLPKDAFVIVSIGVINRLKRLTQVLEAFDEFHDSCPNSYFVLAGPADPVVLRQMNSYCKARKLKHCVRFLGHRETHELYEVIDLADVCVNLRYPSMGESSATLASILAMGKPVLTTPIPQYLEFPDSVCWKVRLGSSERRELVDYFRALHASPETAKALGSNAREFVRGWGWGDTASRYEKVLRQAASLTTKETCCR